LIALLRHDGPQKYLFIIWVNLSLVQLLFLELSNIDFRGNTDEN
jgi:hypothetical protein